MFNYWNTLSYGKLAFGIDTPRDSTNIPLIPTIDPPDAKPKDWKHLINQCLRANLDAIWRAAGSLIWPYPYPKRWIPSLVLVQNYRVNASAHFYSYDIDIEGEKYLVGDRAHGELRLDKWTHPWAHGIELRKGWGTLCHEYAHNFLQFKDLYGPQGCTGY